MPRLRPVRIVVEHKGARKKLAFDSFVYVNELAHFTFSIPDEPKALAEHAEQMRDKAPPGVSVTFNRSGRCISSDTHAKGEAFLRAIAEDFIRVETIEELVIAYRYVSGLNYWINPDGTLDPHGMVHGHNDGHWSNPHADRDDELKGIDFEAAVFRKLTHKSRGTKPVVEYKYWRPEKDGKFDNGIYPEDPRYMLNALGGCDYDGHPGTEDATWREIPYTDKAAAFCFKVKMALCRVDQQLKAFFADPKKVDLAIASGTLPQLGA